MATTSKRLVDPLAKFWNALTTMSRSLVSVVPWRALGCLLVVAAGCSVTSTADDRLASSEAPCPAGSKRCDGRCVSTSDPTTGCGLATCTPCAAPPNASATCQAESCALGPCAQGFEDCDGKASNGCEVDALSDAEHCGNCATRCDVGQATGECKAGSCVVTSCADGFADCDGNGGNGCEVALTTSLEHCGACGVACAQGEVCKQGACTFDENTAAWLASQKGGYCCNKYNQLVNLAGTTGTCDFNTCNADIGLPGDACWPDKGHEYPTGVPFCCDASVMRPYPDGLALTLGFHYDGVSIGSLASLGGDCDNKNVSFVVETAGELRFLPVQGSTSLVAPLTKGPHVVEARVTMASVELFVDGVLVASGKGPGAVPEMTPKCGPGMILGQRVSYWWEASVSGKWMRFSPFLVHLRDGAKPATPWSLEAATKAGPSTVMLFDAAGVQGSTWVSADKKRKAIAVAPNLPDQPPVWVDDVATQCL